jgi:putative hemolysin
VGRLLAGGVDRILGLRTLQRMFEALGPVPCETFPARALEALQVAVESEGGLVPADGPLVIVANHPFGCLDGLAALAHVALARKDVRVLANRWLTSIPPLRHWLAGVDIFGGQDSRLSNATSLRAALAWLENGGCLIVFPAGEVAHREGPGGMALDGTWHTHAATLAVRARADVLPVCIGGTNRRAFRWAGHVHPLLRTALLPRELLARRGRPVRLVVGEPIPARAVEQLPVADRASYLRARTYLLASSFVKAHRNDRPAIVRAAPVAPPVSPSLVADDIERLRPDRLVNETGSLAVYCARASELPHVLSDIGRLRETTFRSVGEGTGQPRDLDAFDEWYWHLFAWDRQARAIAGGYRLAVTTDILPVHGVSGLYTRTLFEYDERLLREIGPALELGRSFVCERYQRGFAPLLALWKGIGTFVAQRPECSRVFGAVSISSRYDTLSRQLLVSFLSSAARRHRAARLVRPLRPMRPSAAHGSLVETATVTSLEGLSSLLAAIEPDGKSVPVLVRQYLNLNARLLGFSVDPSFGDALDGLMLADLTEVPRPMLRRIMGADNASRFLTHQFRNSECGMRNTELTTKVECGMRK